MPIESTETVADHTWSNEGRLGIFFRAHSTGPIFITKVDEELSPTWIVGRSILKVNDLVINGQTKEEVSQAIRAAGRPLTLRFGDKQSPETTDKPYMSLREYFSTRKIPAMQVIPLVMTIVLPWVDPVVLGLLDSSTMFVLFMAYQVPVLCVHFLVYRRISTSSDDEDKPKIKIPEKKHLGTVMKEAHEQTVREYDMSVWEEKIKQYLVGFWIVAGLYYKWEMYTPIIFAVCMVPAMWYEEPLFQVHLRGKEIDRPFPSQSFGFMVEKENTKPSTTSKPEESPAQVLDTK